MDDLFDKPKSCSIIIVTYNSTACISACLVPLADMADVEIVVVDNDSNDGTGTKLKEQFPSVTLIALQDNIGFGRACNIGVAASSGSFVFLLNPDAVAPVQAIRTLIGFFEKHLQAGIVGGRLVDPSGLPLQSMGDRPTFVRLVLEKPIEWVAQRINPFGILHRGLEKYFAKFRMPGGAEHVHGFLVRPYVVAVRLGRISAGSTRNFFSIMKTLIFVSVQRRLAGKCGMCLRQLFYINLGLHSLVT